MGEKSASRSERGFEYSFPMIVSSYDRQRIVYTMTTGPNNAV